MMATDVEVLPSCVFWNMRFLSVHRHETWDAKIKNLNSMIQSRNIVALSETHVGDKITAEKLFFTHVKASRKFYGSGMAFVVAEEFAKLHNIVDRNVTEIIPGVAMCLRWAADGNNFWVLHFRLDASSELSHVQQLNRLTDWYKQNVSEGDLLIVGGDRNFTEHDGERESSRRTPWRPSPRMNEAWQRFLSETQVHILQQP